MNAFGKLFTEINILTFGQYKLRQGHNLKLAQLFIKMKHLSTGKRSFKTALKALKVSDAAYTAFKRNSTIRKMCSSNEKSLQY